MSEEAKQAILDFIKKRKGKTKFYLIELSKAVPDMQLRQTKEIISELVKEGKLKYSSNDSTTLYILPGTNESD